MKLGVTAVLNDLDAANGRESVASASGSARGEAKFLRGSAPAMRAKKSSAQKNQEEEEDASAAEGPNHAGRL
ncbi:MAG: hypothetical protein M1453_11640 [Acidobacteria bacterium]|nr:hypothetical protein [Acidobacteriota bacterium]